MQSFDFKKLLPHLLIILGFAVVSIIYCLPAYKGMELAQHDILSWKAMSHESKAYYDSTHINPLWTNSMFGGMPTYVNAVQESHNSIGSIQTIVTGLFKKPAYFFFLAMLGFYLLLNALRVNRWLGIVGAIAFAFSTYNPVIIAAGHETKMLSLAYMCIALAGIIHLYRGSYIGGGAILAISLALLFANTHYQMAFYLAIIILLMVIGFFINALKEQQLKAFFIASAIAVVAAGLSLGVNAAGLMTTVGEYNKYSMRGGVSELKGEREKPGLNREYAFRWSNGVAESFCAMIPYLYGGSSAETFDHAPETAAILESQGYDKAPLYWGPQNLGISGPMYFGAVVCFLFVLGMCTIRNRMKWFLFAAAALGMMLGMGKNLPWFNNWVFDHIPKYNSFRTPTIAVTIAEIIFPLIGIWGLSELLKNTDRKQAWKHLKIAAGITAGICLLFGLGGSMFLSYTNHDTESGYPAQILDALKADRSALAMKSSFISAFYILAAAALVWAFIKDKINATILTAGIGLLIVIDLLPVSMNYLNEDKYTEAADADAIFAPRPVDQQILQDKDPYYRVMDISQGDPYNDAMPAYNHKIVGGYHPAKMLIYQELIERQLSKGYNSEVLNMLNTKYIIFTPGQGAQPAMQPLPTACGNAWFVNEVKWVATADDEMNGLNAPALGDTAQAAPNGFHASQTAIMRNNFQQQVGNAIGKDSNANIKLTKYGLNTLEYVSSNSKDGLAVFSDIYYPTGWHATVDGKETPIMRADYVLRAIRVPAGTHNIKFDFHPESFYKGDQISLYSCIILWIAAILSLVLVFRSKKMNDTGII